MKIPMCLSRVIAFPIFAATLVAYLPTPFAQAAGPAELFGPVTALRAIGKPEELTFSFPKISGYEAPFYLVVFNGEVSGSRRVSSASVYLNGDLIVRESALNQRVAEIVREVNLTEMNALVVRLRSAPGSFLKIAVIGQRTDEPDVVIDESSVLVGPGGGTGSLENFATVTLPESALRPELTLVLQKLYSPAKLLLHESETPGAGPAVPELLKITSSENVSTSVALSVRIPPSFVAALPPDFNVELFAEYTQIGADGEIISSFERLGATFDPVSGLAHANLPPHAFTPANSVTTTIIAGSYPNAPATQVVANIIEPSQPVEAKPNESIALRADLSFSIPPQVASPLAGALTVNSDFGSRIHPITGQASFHTDVDYDTSSQPVYATAADTVVASEPQVPCTLVNRVYMTGFSHRVRIDHGNGITTVYAHLEPDGLSAVGSQIAAGGQIGISDTTGTATGDHLHFEYRLNGNPLDPELFMNQQNAAQYLQDLSVVALINGQAVDATRRTVNGAAFTYQSQLDLVPLQLHAGSMNQLSLVVQNASGASAPIVTVPLRIDPLALRVTLRWDKHDTDVDLHVRDSLGNHSWYGNLCGIPNGCLDRDDVDGFGPEVFDLSELAPGVSYTVFLHYYSDHGNGPTTATVVVEQGTQTFGPFSFTLSDNQSVTVGTFPQ